MNLKKTPIALVCGILLTGCGTVEKVRNEIREEAPVSRANLDEPMQFPVTSRVRVIKGPQLATTGVTVSKSGATWLKSKTVELDAPYPITLSQALAKFAANGINISSDMPLDTIMFRGKINPTDAESALKQMLGASGLDFHVDDTRKLVTIKPIASRTWYFNLGKRKTSYASKAAADVTQSSTNGIVGDTSSNTTNPNANQNNPNGQNTNGASQGNTGVSVEDDFWATLEKELTARTTVMVPAPRGRSYSTTSSSTVIVPAIIPDGGGGGVATAGGAAASVAPSGGATATSSTTTSGDELYVSKKIGAFSLNPETGAVTVQAPQWILNDLDTYFKRVQYMYNAALSFQGQLLLVTLTDSDSEGIDLQAFATWANGRYGAVIANNTLGGITLSFPNGNIPSVTAQGQTVGGALLGVVSPKDGLQLFNAFLQEKGTVSVKEKPVVSTTSNVPGEFSNMTPRYYNLVNQTASTGNVGASQTATQNRLLQKDFGTTLKVSPRFDMSTGLVRAQISMQNVLYSGDQIVQQILTSGNSSVTVNSAIPVDKKLFYSGEALIRDGDFIIVGGQSEDTSQADENGLPSPNGPISGIFGAKRSTVRKGFYYFALKVTVKPR